MQIIILIQNEEVTSSVCGDSDKAFLCKRKGTAYILKRKVEACLEDVPYWVDWDIMAEDAFVDAIEHEELELLIPGFP